MKILIKRVDEPLEIIDSKEKYLGDAARVVLGDDITQERVRFSENLTMVCDEDGLLKELPPNFLASMSNPFYPVQVIVGDVVFVRTKPLNAWEGEIWDLEVEDVTDADVQMINDLLSKDTQVDLITKYLRVGR